MRKATKQSESEPIKPMDVTVNEIVFDNDRPTLITNHPRECYALSTLVAEVKAIDPAVKYTAEEPDVTNACLDVTFEGCKPDLIEALDLLSGDERVQHAISGGNEKEGMFYVSFLPNPVTKDSREPFNIAAAIAILNGEES